MPTSEFIVLPVLDLVGGKVVRAVGGKRAEYRPLVPDARPVAVARLLAERNRSLFREFYVADLDALQGGDVQYGVWQELLRELPWMRLWVDAGISNRSQSEIFLAAMDADAVSRSQLIVASETLKSWDDLAAIVSACGAEQIVFSLDLFGGTVRGGDRQVANEQPLRVAQRAAEAGITRMIVLDVAQVGIRQGVSTLPLCRRIRAVQPTIQLFTGGGVRTVDDLARVRDAGCCGALVATALHDGAICHVELAKFLAK